MNLQRFEELVGAYGADPRRWPESERAAAEAFAFQHGAAAGRILAEARGIDTALEHAREPALQTDALAARIISAARVERGAFGVRAIAALAACAVFGVVLGYGSGMLAPAPLEEGDYFAMAFSAPWPIEDEG